MLKTSATTKTTEGTGRLKLSERSRAVPCDRSRPPRQRGGPGELSAVAQDLGVEGTGARRARTARQPGGFCSAISSSTPSPGNTASTATTGKIKARPCDRQRRGGLRAWSGPSELARQSQASTEDHLEEDEGTAECDAERHVEASSRAPM